MDAAPWPSYVLLFYGVVVVSSVTSPDFFSHTHAHARTQIAVVQTRTTTDKNIDTNVTTMRRDSVLFCFKIFLFCVLSLLLSTKTEACAVCSTDDDCVGYVIQERARSRIERFFFPLLLKYLIVC